MIEYRCPDLKYTISRAVHLGRLVRFFAGCRHCPHAADTGTLPPRLVKQLREVGRQEPLRPRFHDEGVGGLYENELTPAHARRMAAALGLCLRQTPLSPRGRGVGGEGARPPKAEVTSGTPLAVVAGDGRPLGAALLAAVSEGLRWAGCDLVDIGPATAPCLVLAIGQLAAAGGILVGNPDGQPRQAGLKFFAPGPAPISGGPWLEAIEQPRARGRGRYPLGASGALLSAALDARACYGSLRRVQAEAAYLAGLSPFYHALRPLRFALDARCPPVLDYLQKLTAPVACRLLPCRTGHVGEEVLAGRAHFGLSIEDDGETCRLWDEQGRPVPPETLLLLLARHLLAQQAGGVVIVEAEASPALAGKIAALGGRAVAADPSRAAMAAAMRQHDALLGGGPSGRLWHAVGRLPLADALRTLTLLLVLLSRDDRPLSEVLDAEAAAG